MTHYRIRVLEVGYDEHFPADFSFGGYFLAGETMFSPFSMTLLQDGSKNILVDCGIDLKNPVKREIFSAANASNGHSPDAVLGTVGLRPADIDAVIVTHLHWDHVSGAACFPNAVFYLQKEELEQWETVAGKPSWQSLSNFCMDLNDVAAFRKLKAEGRLILLEGEEDGLFPGIDVRVSRFAHSFAMQMVMIKHDTGINLVVGDVCSRPENLLGTEAFPFFIPNPKFSVGGMANVILDYERIMKWVDGYVDRVIMTHDGTRNGRYPKEETELGLSVYEICP